MMLWITRVASSKYCKATYSEIRDQWSLRELVDHTHLVEGLGAMEEKHYKDQARALKTKGKLR